MANEKGGFRVKVRKDVEAFLKSLGSTASEAKVYMVLLKARKYLSVKELEEKTGLSSKSVRIALKKLEEKDIVIEKEKDGKKFYRAVSFKEVVEKWKKKVEESLAHLLRRP